MNLNLLPFSNIPVVLPHVNLEWYRPHPLLQKWIQCYWAIRFTSPPASLPSENLYPDAGSTLTIDFIENQLPEMYFNATNRLSKISFQHSTDKIGIHFHPGGAFQMLGIEMANVMGVEYKVNELNLLSICELQESLASISEIAGRISQIDDWFLRQAMKINPQQSYVQRLLQSFANNPASIEYLSQQLPLSRRQLERQFQLEVGIAPAKVKQLQQVKLARLLISKNPEIPMVQIATDTGFYDQPHFIKQFQKVTEQTPGQYRQRKMSQKYNPNKD